MLSGSSISGSCLFCLSESGGRDLVFRVGGMRVCGAMCLSKKEREREVCLVMLSMTLGLLGIRELSGCKNRRKIQG